MCNMNQVSIEIIQKCPNECLHCSSESGKSCDTILDLKLIKNVFDGLADMKVDEVSISGGEPFLHKDIVDIVQYGKSKGFKLYIYTSGIILDDNGNYKPLDKSVLTSIKNNGVDKLIFNFQSLKEEIYNKIMGTTGNLELLKESIRLTKNLGIYTEIHFVPMKLNYNEIEDIVDYINTEGLNKVSFLGLIPHGRAKVNKEELYLDQDTNNKVKELLASYNSEKVRVGIPLMMKREQSLCKAGNSKLYIKFDGNVYGCEAFKYVELKDSNNKVVEPDSIHNMKINDIYNKSRYLQIAKKKVNSVLCNGGGNENCPIQVEFRKGN